MVPAKEFRASRGFQEVRSTAVLSPTAPLTTASKSRSTWKASWTRCPGSDSCGGGCFAGAALQHQDALGGVLARVAAGEGVETQGLPAGGLGHAEREAIGHRLLVGTVEVHLDLVARLVVEARFGVESGDVGVDVHDEDRAALAGEDVEVVDEKLAVLRSLGVSRW
ncbi:hypothetical protein H114_03716 [Streptomyces gancidicus BKS 13-15]|uniref:Uncharacterized protein n=1 Tax=Streptomyces gancidicus BKS 13-15 TaxID=1284664 RepID=M3E9P4_STREZ|nr:MULTISPECIES: hypothetical protein [Streptomyces]EMF30457.1 hypothetical protein H114_03716 [Streptomyces gancidicus BKS 13-15]